MPQTIRARFRPPSPFGQCPNIGDANLVGASLSGAILLPSSIQVKESISGSVVPLAMFLFSMLLLKGFSSWPNSSASSSSPSFSAFEKCAQCSFIFKPEVLGCHFPFLVHFCPNPDGLCQLRPAAVLKFGEIEMKWQKSH